MPFCGGRRALSPAAPPCPVCRRSPVPADTPSFRAAPSPPLVSQLFDHSAPLPPLLSTLPSLLSSPDCFAMHPCALLLDSACVRLVPRLPPCALLRLLPLRTWPRAVPPRPCHCVASQRLQIPPLNPSEWNCAVTGPVLACCLPCASSNLFRTTPFPPSRPASLSPSPALSTNVRHKLARTSQEKSAEEGEAGKGVQKASSDGKRGATQERRNTGEAGWGPHFFFLSSPPSRPANGAPFGSSGVMSCARWRAAGAGWWAPGAGRACRSRASRPPMRCCACTATTQRRAAPHAPGSRGRGPG